VAGTVILQDQVLRDIGSVSLKEILDDGRVNLASHFYVYIDPAVFVWIDK
jgi:hypothetical protein